MPSIVANFSVLDAVLVAILLAGLVAGLVQGMVRQMLLLAAVYFGIVLAAQYYVAAATGLALLIPGGEARAYSTVGLILVFVVVTLTINALGYVTYGSTRLRALASADHAGGAVLGSVSAWLLITLFVAAANFALDVPLGGLQEEQQEVAMMIQQSALIPAVHGSMPVLYETLRPWVPSGLPAPFAS